MKEKKKIRKFIANYLNMDKECKAVLKTAFQPLPENPSSNLVVAVITEYFINVQGFITPELIRNWKIINYGNRK